MTDQLVISLATVPDIASLRAIHKFEGLSDEGVLSASLHLHKQQFGNAKLPLYLQQIVSIAVVNHSGSGKITVHCPAYFQNESELLQWFVNLFGSDVSLISWDMVAFDKPLLTYRLLKHGIVSECFNQLETVALKDKLSNKNGESATDLAGLSLSLGLPEIDSMTQAATTDYFIKKQLTPVDDANRASALNVCAIYQKYQMINAVVLPAEFEAVSAALYEEKS